MEFRRVLFRSRPALQWVFIGATGFGTTYSFDARPDFNAELDQLNSLGNVHFLGVKDRSEIPVYLNGCDVLSLPLSTSFVGFPTKLYEYLASGKPVISWNGENIRPLAHLIAPADGVAAWLGALDLGRAQVRERVCQDVWNTVV